MVITGSVFINFNASEKFHIINLYTSAKAKWLSCQKPANQISSSTELSISNPKPDHLRFMQLKLAIAYILSQIFINNSSGVL